MSLTWMVTALVAAAAGSHTNETSHEQGVRQQQWPQQQSPQQQPEQVITVASCTNAADCTEELQAALYSCAPTVQVPALPEGRSWVVRPIAVTCDAQTIDFAAGAVLQAKRGEYHRYGGEGSLLFSIKNRTDVTVLGNGGATFRMWREDYGNPALYNHSEGRHGLAIYGSQNILLSGLTVTETGGDGVYLLRSILHDVSPWAYFQLNRSKETHS